MSMHTNTVIKEHILSSEMFLKTLKIIPSTSNSRNQVVSWFQELCNHITNMILSILDSHIKTKLTETSKNILMYNLNQLISYLFLTINIFEAEFESKHTLFEARHFAEKQLQNCLNSIQQTLISTETNILDPFGTFIKWIDSALCQISDINSNTDSEQKLKLLQNARELIEELMCHSMSIAQVTTDNDFLVIKGASQVVLEALDTLNSEINKTTSNVSMINMYVDSCCDKLCALEKKVNNSVLKLCLKVFSEFTTPLQNLNYFCSNNNKDHSLEFESLVAEFDLHVDRIMQIGLFALSCSTNIPRCIQIKCSMANLEALESELVPAFNTFLCDSNHSNKYYVDILKQFWISRANILKQHIFLIIDPFAFCQIIYDENKQILSGIQDAVKNVDKVELENLVEKLLQHSKVLQSFLKTISEESEIEAKQIEGDFSNFQKVLHEVQSAKEYFLNKPKSNAEENLRLLKRCKILLSITNRIWRSFSEGSSNIHDENEQIKESSSPPLETENAFLAHIINKGKGILKEHNHSTFYQKSQIDKASQHGTKTSLLKFINLRHLSFANTNHSYASLQITDILNELTTMSNSFDVLKC